MEKVIDDTVHLVAIVMDIVDATAARNTRRRR
jgi:hypothetical protein